jgi:hypothetical protein
MLLVQLKPADVACGTSTLRISPSSGQATVSAQLRHPKLLACHSGAALGRFKAWRQTWNLSVPTEYFYLRPAQGAYADPHKPSTKWHIAQQRHCGTVARGGRATR